MFSQQPPGRQYLLDGLALVLGLAPAQEVAFALQRFWERRAEGAGFLTELRRIAEVSDEVSASFR